MASPRAGVRAAAPRSNFLQRLELEINTFPEIDGIFSELDGSASVPPATILRMITPTVIWREMPSAKPDLVEFICTRATKVFAITASIGVSDEDLWEASRIFRRLEFVDDCLPIPAGNASAFAGRSGQLDLGAHSIWTTSRVKVFYTNQWQFLAPVFTKTQFLYRLHANCLLPFIAEKSTKPELEPFSNGHQVRIFRDHQLMFKEPSHGPRLSFLLKEAGRYGYANVNDPRLRFQFGNGTYDDPLGPISGHPQIMKRLAVIEQGGKLSHFLFLWPDGGTLQDFWMGHPEPRFPDEMISEMLIQLRGLAHALVVLNGANSQPGGRIHANLHPKSIVRFKQDGSSLGRLQVGDLGHDLERNWEEGTYEPSSHRASTAQSASDSLYEAPEIFLADSFVPTHLSDTWSMGCLILEFILWLFQGNRGLEDFRLTLLAGSETGRFFEIDHRGKVEVHAEVRYRIGRLIRPVGRINPAITELLVLVRDRLLVPQIGSTPDQDDATQRADANALLQDVDEILQKATVARDHPTRMGLRELNLGREPAIAPRTFVAPQRLPVNPEGNWRSVRLLDSINGVSGSSMQITSGLDNTWEILPDEEFIATCLGDVESRIMPPPDAETGSICADCENLAFSRPEGLKLKVSHLEKNSDCAVCRYMLKVYRRRPGPRRPAFTLWRKGSSLHIDSFGPAAISLRKGVSSLGDVEPEWDPVFEDSEPDVASGLASLPRPGSSEHFAILRHWLRDCDENHQCAPTARSSAPTRLLLIHGTTVKLCETGAGRMGRYAALSHPWGDPRLHPPFRTETGNLAAHRAGILVTDLPQTFQDAVSVTRALGLRYLWIDSLCIIQGDEQDWLTQSRRMEDIFHNAYVVLAATSAQGSSDGFLKPRPERGYVALPRLGKPSLYLCDPIDDFQGDVLDQHLNQRGWVLQERVLARRTIHFAGQQTYWQCGSGVRCETMTRMQNQSDAILADPHFPDYASRFVKVARIRLYESLYQAYSRLAFTHPTDRPLGIHGLEKRLLRSFDTRGAFGILERSLHRSLLWWRDPSEPSLRRISFPPGREVPTWSWMAYDGVISYAEVAFESFDWTSDVSSPWARPGLADASSPPLLLPAVARDLHPPSHTAGAAASGEAVVSPDDYSLVIDSPKDFQQPLQCVVVGKARTAEEGQLVLILLVARRGDQAGLDILVQ